jgi:hypothetical protein
MAGNGGKGVHGQFPRGLDDKSMDKEQTYRWLKNEHITGVRGRSRKYRSDSSGMNSHHKLLSNKIFERNY